MLKETGGCILLKLEPPAHRSAGVDQQAKLQRQVSLLNEIHNRLRRFVIVQNAEIVLVQIAHEFAVLIHSDEQHIHFVDAFLYGDN